MLSMSGSIVVVFGLSGMVLVGSTLITGAKSVWEIDVEGGTLLLLLP